MRGLGASGDERSGSSRSRPDLLLLPGVVLALIAIGAFVALAMLRIDYGFELEWMEGGSLQHLARMLAGEPLYPAPSIEFVPFPYPPFYYWAAALITPLYGVSFVSLRMVSVLSTLGSFALIFTLVRFETRRWEIGLIAAGIFASTYRASGAYMDVARLDSLFLLLLLASASLLRMRTDVAGALGAAVLAFLAIWTKQTGLVALAPLFVWCAYMDHRDHGLELARWRIFPCYAGVALALVGTATALTSRGENAHFLFYVIGAQSGHEIQGSKIVPYFAKDLFGAVPLAFIAPLSWWAIARRRPDGVRLFFHLTFAVGVGVACMVPRIKVGGALNNLIPIHAVLAIVAGIGLGGWSTLGREAPDRRWIGPGVSAAIVLQLLWCFYDPRVALPDPADAAHGERLVARLARVEGEVLIPAHGYLARYAGKRVFAHQMPVDDLSRSGLVEAEDLRVSFSDAIRARRFAMIVDSTSRFLRSYPDAAALRENYRLVGPVFGSERRLVPRSGWQVSPGDVWVPRSRIPRPSTR